MQNAPIAASVMSMNSLNTSPFRRLSHDSRNTGSPTGNKAATNHASETPAA